MFVIEKLVKNITEMSTSEINLRVTGQSSQGGRRYMEDAFVVAYQQTEDKKDLEYAFFGIFDGHGGREAAQYAKNNLLDNIVTLKQFWLDDDDMVLSAIRDGFLNTHLAMWKEVGFAFWYLHTIATILATLNKIAQILNAKYADRNMEHIVEKYCIKNWPKTASGLPSTAGTTASVAFIRKGKLYTGHVGDSRIVIGLKEQGLDEWQAESLTIDHKPECPREKQRILESGGLVMNKSGVERVVWKRPRPGHEGPILRSTDFEKIPFLAVARSLGDLWSYDYFQQEFAVSPEPDLGVMSLDLNKDKCLILASDGLWNIMSPQSAVHLVQDVESENRKLVSKFGISENIHLTLCNPSRVLVDCGLERWNQLRTRADNVSVITVMLDPSEVGVLKEQLVLKMNYPRSLSVWDVGLRCKNFGDLLEAHGVENKMGYLRLVPRSASLTKAESLPNCFIGESNCDSDEGESSCSPLQPCSNFLPQHSSASKILRKMEAEGIENSPCRFPRWSKNATGRTSLSKLATWSKVVSHRRMSDPFPRMEVHPVNTEALSDSEGILEKNVDGLQERSIEPDLCDNDKDLKMGWNQLSGIKQAIKRKYPGTDVSQSFIGVENSQKRKVASSLLIMSNVIQS